MKKYNLFLDDIRQPEVCILHMKDERYITLDWIIVRNHEEFVSEINKKWEEGEFPELVSFDHDLSDEHYDESMFEGVEAYEIVYTTFTNPTGRRSAEYLVEFCKEKNIDLPECLVHSMNPAGKERIISVLKID